MVEGKRECTGAWGRKERERERFPVFDGRGGWVYAMVESNIRSKADRNFRDI